MANILLSTDDLKNINLSIKLNSDILLNINFPSIEQELLLINNNIQGDGLESLISKINNEFSEIKTSLSKELENLYTFLEKQTKAYRTEEEELEIRLSNILNKMSAIIEREEKKSTITNHKDFNTNDYIKQTDLNNKIESDLSETSYKNDSSAGFNVTSENKSYELSQSEKELLMAIVAAEADKSSKDDCLAVVSVILNRCEDPAWVNSHGSNPISQATAPNQFVVYQEGLYKKYLNGNVPDNVKQAVEDALNGMRNCNYLSFRSNGNKSYSNNMISETGNRYA